MCSRSLRNVRTEPGQKPQWRRNYLAPQRLASPPADRRRNAEKHDGCNAQPANGRKAQPEENDFIIRHSTFIVSSSGVWPVEPQVARIRPSIIDQEQAMSTTRVGHILDQVGSIAFAGVYDTLSAKLAQQAGFPLAFISGYSVAATAIGEPDLGLLTQTEMIERARHICRSVDIPIIVDADTGYGNPLNVYRTIKELIAAGAAGCFLEDQVWPKKCGHMRGKRVVERDEYVQKIRAAAEARGNADFFIVARTDALAPVGIDEAIARVTAARQAGADASFVEAPPSLELLAEIGRRAPRPMVANMLEGGKTPVLPKEQLAQMGFQLILYPLTALFAAARAIEGFYKKLRSDGTTLGEENRLMTFAEFNALIGVDEKYALAERFGVQ
jgi:2-methylisocitrate lyase-like PEP mutase family enzyme